MVQQFIFYLNKYQVLPNFQLKGEKGEVQAHLVLMQHCKSSLVQVDKVVVGEVIATVSATIKIHILFYKHFKLVKTLYIVPKGENIVLVSNAFKYFNHKKRRPEAPKCQPHQKQEIQTYKKSFLCHTGKSRRNNEKQLFTLINCN